MPIADAHAALAFIDQHGVVLVSAAGPVPRLTDAIAGEPVKGSWWAHRQGKRIFSVLEAVKASPDILVCRMIAGKLTLVHRRLWPMLLPIAHRFKPGQLARVKEEHTASGRHVNTETAFPQWLPEDAGALAASLSVDACLAVFGQWAERPPPRGSGQH
jgi:hypothetical protein